MSRLNDLIPGLSVVALLVTLTWPHAPDGGPPPLEHLIWPSVAGRTAAPPRLADLSPAVPPPACGADVVLAEALVDPTDGPDRDGEWVRILHRGPEPIPLDGWVLERGRRRLRLGTIVVDGAVTLGGGGLNGDLGPIRLPNRAGELILYDPCGEPRARLAWGGSCPRVPAGWTVVAPGLEREGPARSVTGGALGGCGQT